MSLQKELGLGALPSFLATQTGLEFMKNVVHHEKSEPIPSQSKTTALAEINEASRMGKGMDECQVCVYVLERIKQGYQFLLPAICVELFSKEKNAKDGQASFAQCHQVLAALSVWGNNVRHWFHYGCYKSETYGAMELIRPCPSRDLLSDVQF